MEQSRNKWNKVGRNGLLYIGVRKNWKEWNRVGKNGMVWEWEGMEECEKYAKCGKK